MVSLGTPSVYDILRDFALPFAGAVFTWLLARHILTTNREDRKRQLEEHHDHLKLLSCRDAMAALYNHLQGLSTPATSSDWHRVTLGPIVSAFLMDESRFYNETVDRAWSRVVTGSQPILPRVIHPDGETTMEDLRAFDELAREFMEQVRKERIGTRFTATSN